MTMNIDIDLDKMRDCPICGTFYEIGKRCPNRNKHNDTKEIDKIIREVEQSLKDEIPDYPINGLTL